MLHATSPAAATPAGSPTAPRPPREAVAAQANLDDWIAAVSGSSVARPGADGAPFVVCNNIYKSYGSREVLRGVDFSVRRGEVVVIMGPSGSGKSTLLRLVNHLEHLDWGEITVGGEHVGYEKVGRLLKPKRDLAGARAAARIGMVFQGFNLFDHLTAIENVIETPIPVTARTTRGERGIWA